MARHVAADARGVAAAALDQRARDVLLPGLRAFGLGMAEQEKSAHGRV